MSGAGTKFVSEHGDYFSLSSIVKTPKEVGPSLAVIDANSNLALTSDDIDRLIETLHKIQDELNS